METEQKCPEKFRKLQTNKTSNQDTKPVTGKQNKTCSASRKTTKPQKLKESETTVPKQGTKGPSPNVLAKNKNKTENNQGLNKADANKDGNKKQAKKRNKKRTDLIDERVKECCQEPEKKKEQVIAQVGSKEEQSKLQNGDASKKLGSEISRSKKRRIRKKRLLESLGINIVSSVISDKSKSSKKKKKKKKSRFVKCPELSHDSITNENSNIKSGNFNEVITNGSVRRSKDSVCDNTGKKGAIKKSDNTVESVTKTNDINISYNKKKPEIPKSKDIKLERKFSETVSTEFKGNKVSSNNSVPTKVYSNHQEAQQFKRPEKELSQLEAKNCIEDTSHKEANKNKDNSVSSGKVDLVNFLSHDNVEGLFRSALLNDVTLSSRCSEKEVKNFFNTYGTFSERGRTQFATVEKLLNSGNKDSDDIATSQYFEPELDKEITPSLTLKNLSPVSNKDISYDITTPTVTSVTSPKCDCLSAKIIKDTINTEEPLRISPDINLESESTYSQIVKGLNTESVGCNSVFKGNLYRGPIYTSPNLENRVTTTSNTSQILNSSSRVFVSNAYQNNCTNSQSVPEQDKSELNGLSVVENQTFCEENSYSNTSLAKDSSKEKSKKSDKNSSSQVNSVSTETKKAEGKDSLNHHSTVNSLSSFDIKTEKTHGIRKESDKDKTDSNDKNVKSDHTPKENTIITTTEGNDTCVKNKITEIRKDTSARKNYIDDKSDLSKSSKEPNLKHSYDKTENPSIKNICQERPDIRDISTNKKQVISIDRTEQSILNVFTENTQGANINNTCTEDKINLCKQDTVNKEDIGTTKESKNSFYPEEKDACIVTEEKIKDYCLGKKDRLINDSCPKKTEANTKTYTCYVKDGAVAVKEICTDRRDECATKDTHADKVYIDQKEASGIRNICSNKEGGVNESDTFTSKINKEGIKVISEKKNTIVVKDTCTEQKETNENSTISGKGNTNLTNIPCIDKKDSSTLKEITNDRTDSSADKEIKFGRKDTSSIKEISPGQKDINSKKDICTKKRDTNSTKEITSVRKDSSPEGEISSAKKDSSVVEEICNAKSESSVVKEICSAKKHSSVDEIGSDEKDTAAVKKICNIKEDCYTGKEISIDKDPSIVKINSSAKNSVTGVKEVSIDRGNTCTEEKVSSVLQDTSDKKDPNIANTSVNKKEVSLKNTYGDDKHKSVKKIQKGESVKEISDICKKDIHTKEFCNIDKNTATHTFEGNSKPQCESLNWSEYSPKSNEDIHKTSTSIENIIEPLLSCNKLVLHSQVPIKEEHSAIKSVSGDNSTSDNNLSEITEKEKRLKSEGDTSDNIKTEIPAISTLISTDNFSEGTMKPTQVKPPAGGNVQRTEKTREEIIAEREAKKAAKLAAKSKSKGSVLMKKDNAEILNKNTSSVSKNIKEKSIIADKSNLPESAKPVIKQEVRTVDKSVPSKSNQMSEETTATDTIKVDPQSKAESITEKTEAVAAKSKAELRAERRAKQEAQRAAKTQQQVKTAQPKPAAQVSAATKEKSVKQETGDDITKKTTKVVAPAAKTKTPEHRVKLFNHLYHERGPLSLSENLMLSGSDLHPAIVKLGMQYADRLVVGSNARCIALLDALKQVVWDYETPPQKEFSRGLEAELQPSVAFLGTCRPLSVSMTNALRYLMRQLTQLPNNVTDSEAKKKLMDAIDTYIREQIDMAAQAICIMVQRKIANGDVILTYGCSSLIQRILLEAHASGTKFRVIIVDGRPWNEGREMLRRLVERGLDCSYVLVPAASFIMREATKVLLGAHALLANGYVMSRAGSSQVALLAHSYNVPVLVCCETHKFCERVQTDSFVYNELGNPDDLIPANSRSKEVPLSKWKNIGSLTPLNLTYDVTPPDLVSAVVTELGILPCTSVPVILRIKPSEIGC